MSTVAILLAALAVFGAIAAMVCARHARQHAIRQALNADRAIRFRRAIERKGRVVEIITKH